MSQTIALPHTPAHAARAIARWAASLPAARYLVTGTNSAGVEVLRRWWPAYLLAEAAALLQDASASGVLIGARPWCTRQVLVSGLTPASLARLRDAHRVAAAVQVEPGVLEAWVTIDRRPVDAQTASQVAALLAVRAGGDLARAHAAQPGHLPGLSNAAAALRPGVLAPVTHLLTAAAPAADPAGPALVAEAAASLGRAPYPVPRAQAARPPAPARRGWRSAARPRARATGLANPVREEVA